MVVLATKSLESPALQSEFPAQVLFSESFCSEKFLVLKPMFRFGAGKGWGKWRTEFWILGNMRFEPEEIWRPKAMFVWWAVSSLPAGIQLVSDPVSYPRICPVHSGWSPSLLGTPQVLAREMKQERLAGQSCSFHSHPSMWGSEWKPPHSLPVPPALQCRPSLSFSNDHCGVMLW